MNSRIAQGSETVRRSAVALCVGGLLVFAAAAGISPRVAFAGACYGDDRCDEGCPDRCNKNECPQTACSCMTESCPSIIKFGCLLQHCVDGIVGPILSILPSLAPADSATRIWGLITTRASNTAPVWVPALTKAESARPSAAAMSARANGRLAETCPSPAKGAAFLPTRATRSGVLLSPAGKGTRLDKALSLLVVSIFASEWANYLELETLPLFGFTDGPLAQNCLVQCHSISRPPSMRIVAAMLFMATLPFPASTG